SAALNALLADMFALYLKTKNFHWHVSGAHFRDYHLLLDEQADQIFATTDPIAERVRKIGGRTLHSIGQIGRLQRLRDNYADHVRRAFRDNRQDGSDPARTQGRARPADDRGNGQDARRRPRRGREMRLSV